MHSGLGAALSLAAAFAGIYLGLRFLLPLCLPFLLGLGLALAAEPLVAFTGRRLRLPRAVGSAVGVSAAFLGIFSLIFLIISFLFRELRLLSGILPDLEQAMASGISLLEDRLLAMAALAPRSIRPLLEQNVRQLFSGGTALLTEAGKYILSLAGGVLTRIPGSFLSLGTAVISGFMISARLPGLRSWFRRRLPAFRPALQALGRIRRAVGCWLLAQVRLSFVSFLILTMGFVILKIPYAPLWAAGTALLDALPVLGTGTVLLPWGLVCFLQQDTPRAIGLIGIYAAASLTRSALEPRFLGRQLGLDPLLMLTVLWAGYRLFGLSGMLLAPIFAVTALQILPGSRKEPE